MPVTNALAYYAAEEQLMEEKGVPAWPRNWQFYFWFFFWKKEEKVNFWQEKDTWASTLLNFFFLRQ